MDLTRVLSIPVSSYSAYDGCGRGEQHYPWQLWEFLSCWWKQLVSRSKHKKQRSQATEPPVPFGTLNPQFNHAVGASPTPLHLHSRRSGTWYWRVFFGALFSRVGREATRKQSVDEFCNFTPIAEDFFRVRLIILGWLSTISFGLWASESERPSETTFFLLKSSVQLFTTVVIYPESGCLSMFCSSSGVSSWSSRSSFKSARAAVCASEAWVSLEKALVRLRKTFVRNRLLYGDDRSKARLSGSNTVA